MQTIAARKQKKKHSLIFSEYLVNPDLIKLTSLNYKARSKLMLDNTLS